MLSSYMCLVGPVLAIADSTFPSSEKVLLDSVVLERNGKSGL